MWQLLQAAFISLSRKGILVYTIYFSFSSFVAISAAIKLIIVFLSAVPPFFSWVTCDRATTFCASWAEVVLYVAWIASPKNSKLWIANKLRIRVVFTKLGFKRSLSFCECVLHQRDIWHIEVNQKNADHQVLLSHLLLRLLTVHESEYSLFEQPLLHSISIKVLW